MPELPDVEGYLTALRPRTIGATLERVRLRASFLLRTVDPPIRSVEGEVVRDVRRVGKRLAFGFENGEWLVIHLMIAGRLHWRDPGAAIGARNDLAAFDFSTGTLTLTEAGSKRRAALHVLADEAALAALDPGGLDVLATDIVAFRAVLSRENHTLKRALTDPRLLSGIGNAYSDEILFAARLSPVLLTQRLSDDEWQRLFDATQATLRSWTERFVSEAKERFPERVTAFREEMNVHGRYGKPCRVCGAPIARIRYADNETNYCARCQNAGKLLADRSLSRLLKDDWPRTVEELESLTRGDRAAR